MANLLARLNIAQDNGVLVAEFSETKLLDEVKINQVQEGLLTLLKGKSHALLLLDFANVDFFGSAALSMLLVVNDQVKKQNGQMRLVNIKPQLMQIFSLTKLDRILHIAFTRAGAISTLLRVAQGMPE